MSQDSQFPLLCSHKLTYSQRDSVITCHVIKPCVTFFYGKYLEKFFHHTVEINIVWFLVFLKYPLCSTEESNVYKLEPTWGFSL